MPTISDKSTLFVYILHMNFDKQQTTLCAKKGSNVELEREVFTVQFTIESIIWYLYTVVSLV